MKNEHVKYKKNDIFFILSSYLAGGIFQASSDFFSLLSGIRDWCAIVWYIECIIVLNGLSLFGNRNNVYV